MCDDIAKQDDLHVLPGIGEGILACSEEEEYGIQEDEAQYGEDNSCDAVETDIIRQYLVGGRIVLLPQQNRDQRGGSDSHKGAEGRTEVHKRECDSQA